MKINAAKYGLFSESFDYQLLKKDVELIVDTMQKKSYMQKLDSKQLSQYVSLLIIDKIERGRDPYLVCAITSAETEFSPHKISRSMSGMEIAHGLNQVTEDAGEFVQKQMLCNFDYSKKDLLDVYVNTECALGYLQWIEKNLCKQFHWKNANPKYLAYAYNGGLINTIKAIATHQWETYLPEETREYGEKVMYYYTNYKAKRFDVWYYRIKTNTSKGETNE
jgi:soluble lytic murein transglycosylase-like protein